MSLTLRKQRRTPPYAKVAPLAADARDTAVKYAGSTKDWAAPKAAAAKGWAAPKVEPAVDKVKDELVPAVVGAVTAALAASEPARHEAAVRGSAALAALKGEVAPPKPKKHRIRKLFLLASVVGAAYAGWKAWVAKSTAASNPVEPWSSSPSPSSGPSFASNGGSTMSSPGSGSPEELVAPVDRPTTDDPGGAGPDEALADAADESAADSATGVPKPAKPTTEKVTPAQAKKTSEAAAKGNAPKKPSGGATTS